MSITQVDKHFEEGLVALIPPFWGKPVIAAILRSYLRQVQQFENDTFEVLEAFHIDTCDEARLAVLGRVVCQPNFGWSPEAYRNVIRAKIAANRSHGTENDIVNVLRLAGNVTGAVEVYHFAPATMMVVVHEELDEDEREAVFFLLPKTRAAGVRMHLLTAPAGGGFTFASSVSGGGGDFPSSVSGGGDNTFSARVL
jgi:hypothetical protein